MYTDTLFNFSQMSDDFGPEETASILERMAKYRPLFALDSGVSADDIWSRAEKYRQCVELLEDEDDKRTLNSMIHFCAGIMPDSDSVENRFDAVETLEKTILDFKSSDDPFADRLVAIGPCGIDHDWDSVEYKGRNHEYFDQQMIEDELNLFALELTLGKKLNMPVILHSRKSFKDTADVLKAIKWNKGVVHGFAYSQSELDFFLDLGWYVSFSGTVTYAGKKMGNDMAEMVSYVPKDRILIESDSPYYAPVPLKNTSNSPDNISYIYEYVASKRNISSRKLGEIVDANCQKLFGL